MKDLLAAFTIFAKYSDDEYPTNCDHDILKVSVSPAQVADSDIDRLKELGFEPDESDDNFYSYKFGSN